MLPPVAAPADTRVVHVRRAVSFPVDPLEAIAPAIDRFLELAHDLGLEVRSRLRVTWEPAGSTPFAMRGAFGAWLVEAAVAADLEVDRPAPVPPAPEPIYTMPPLTSVR